MRLDLHMHTTYSDGRSTPRELQAIVMQQRLETWAITDHDTTAGYADLEDDLPPIIGVELSCADGEAGEIHLTGLGIDRHHPGLQTLLRDIRRARQQRLRDLLPRILEQSESDIFLFDHVVEEAQRRQPQPQHSDDLVLTRSHLQSALRRRDLTAAAERLFLATATMLR